MCVFGASWWQRTRYRSLSACWREDQVGDIATILKLMLFGADKGEGAKRTNTLHQMAGDKASAHEDRRSRRKRGKRILTQGITRDNLLSLEAFLRILPPFEVRSQAHGMPRRVCASWWQRIGHTGTMLHAPTSMLQCNTMQHGTRTFWQTFE